MTPRSSLRTGFTLAILLIFAPDNRASENSVMVDMQAKIDACSAVNPQTSGSANCAATCRKTLFRLEVLNKRQKLTDDIVEKLGSTCNKAYSALGFDPDVTPTTKPATLAERVSAGPEKGSYCATVMSGLTCSYTQLQDHRQLCFSANRCADFCTKGLKTDIPDESDSHYRQKMIAVKQTLNICETSYEATRKHLE